MMPGPQTYRLYLRQLERSGYTLVRTGSDHLRITHPTLSGPVFCAMTPSSRRTLNNLRALLARKHVARKGNKP